MQGADLVGGREPLATELAEAASCAPDRFLVLIPELTGDAYHVGFVRSILRGAASHLRYRFENLQPGSGKWEPEEPMPRGSVLAERLVGAVERLPSIWQDEWSTAQVLEGCASAVEGPEAVDRLVWQLFRLGRANQPEAEQVRFDPGRRTEVEAQDLVQDAINEPRGIAAVSSMELASGLAERNEAWPELLAPLLRSLASDPVASVRAGVLRHLPFLLHKKPDLGWDLLARCLTAPQSGLWVLAADTLYYQLRDQYERVSPYLDRMLAEARSRPARPGLG